MRLTITPVLWVQISVGQKQKFNNIYLGQSQLSGTEWTIKWSVWCILGLYCVRCFAAPKVSYLFWHHHSSLRLVSRRLFNYTIDWILRADSPSPASSSQLGNQHHQLVPRSDPPQSPIAEVNCRYADATVIERPAVATRSKRPKYSILQYCLSSIFSLFYLFDIYFTAIIIKWLNSTRIMSLITNVELWTQQNDNVLFFVLLVYLVLINAIVHEWLLKHGVNTASSKYNIVVSHEERKT